jgi:hypothetical protein
LGFLQREDAIQVLRGIIRVCADNGVLINSISLIAPSHGNGLMGYQLKIGTRLDSFCRASLMPLLNERGLEMEENKDYIVVFQRQ